MTMSPDEPPICWWDEEGPLCVQCDVVAVDRPGQMCEDCAPRPHEWDAEDEVLEAADRAREDEGDA